MLRTRCQVFIHRTWFENELQSRDKSHLARSYWSTYYLMFASLPARFIQHLLWNEISSLYLYAADHISTKNFFFKSLHILFHCSDPAWGWGVLIIIHTFSACSLYNKFQTGFLLMAKRQKLVSIWSRYKRYYDRLRLSPFPAKA